MSIRGIYRFFEREKSRRCEEGRGKGAWNVASMDIKREGSKRIGELLVRVPIVWSMSRGKEGLKRVFMEGSSSQRRVREERDGRGFGKDDKRDMVI
ncbi:MAG: hypothetical protein GY940_35205, partial [bacterium]|nr:hypothetical protein [bacterium]